MQLVFKNFFGRAAGVEICVRVHGKSDFSRSERISKNYHTIRPRGKDTLHAALDNFLLSPFLPFLLLRSKTNFASGFFAFQPILL